MRPQSTQEHTASMLERLTTVMERLTREQHQSERTERIGSELIHDGKLHCVDLLDSVYTVYMYHFHHCILIVISIF